MTDLAQIALEFCRECLGWERAATCAPYTVEHADAPGESLMHTDLNAVLAAVRQWCDQHDCWVQIQGDYSEAGWLAEVCPSLLDDGESAFSTDPCHALLAACVEANRKLKS